MKNLIYLLFALSFIGCNSQETKKYNNLTKKSRKLLKLKKLGILKSL